MYGDSITNFHRELFKVDIRPGVLTSKLISVKDILAGQRICKLEGLATGPKTYSTVQCGPGPNDHKDLGSDLYYVNHSCDPNVVFDVTSSNPDDWHFRALKDIKSGEELRYFYPATEWEMAQPFECDCKAENCLGLVSGAYKLSREELEERSFINRHILQLLDVRDSSSEESS
ncbi:hypothetical protein FRC02_011628 [Tulasnella sp. 418]|nr:hypothetical protein FRC02_011628 [Tulasnella sp. 418]